jgi:hypothetical protein
MITFSKGDRVRPKKHGDSKSDVPGEVSVRHGNEYFQMA